MIEARIPLVKFNARDLKGCIVPIDISIGTENGIAAVQYLRDNLIGIPPLRPITLFVKALLREKGLNEVFTGGLGSYSIINIVMAFLQVQGYELPATSAKKDTQKKGKEKQSPVTDNDDTINFIQNLKEHKLSHKNDIKRDVGILLWEFFEFFGRKFDYYNQALSVIGGGVVPKGKWVQPKKRWLLAVEDPQDPGREICGGSFEIRKIKLEFERLAAKLAEVCESNQSVTLDAFEGSHLRTHYPLNSSMLATVLDMSVAVGRDVKSVVLRKSREMEYKRASAQYRMKNNSTVVTKATSRKQPNNLGVRKPKLKKSKKQNAPKGKAGARGTKKSRLVEAQWKGKRGQHFEYGYINPGYYTCVYIMYVCTWFGLLILIRVCMVAGWMPREGVIHHHFNLKRATRRKDHCLLS